MCESKKVTWVGPITSCQLCHGDYGSVMYDASVFGRWGNICHDCFKDCGGRLGVGLGQKYHLQGDGSWLLVAGNK